MVSCLLFALRASVGCDKIQASLGRGSEGGAAAASGELPSLEGFEGEIDLLIKGSVTGHPGGVPQTLSLLVKNDKIRTDLPAGAGAEALGGKAYAVLDTPAKKVSVIVDAKKEAIVVDLNKAGDQLKSFAGPHGAGAPGAPPTPPPKVTKTGHKDTVAGFACEDWDIAQADKTKQTVCVAEKGASFFHLPITGIPTEHAWMAELMDGKHFPVRMVAFDKDGAEHGRVELTSVAKKPLDAALFEVPAGYKIVDLQQLFQSLAGGGLPGGLPGAHPHPGRK